jgi:hypothetical protein
LAITFESVKALRGWEDGGRFFTNYIAHPMQGSFVGFIQVQNDPKGMKQRFGGSGRLLAQPYEGDGVVGGLEHAV